MKPSPPTPPLRIALRWDDDSFQAQRILRAIYRRASLTQGLNLQQFDEREARREAGSLAQWQPHGILIRMAEHAALADLRRRWPRIPLVATSVTEPGLVETNVVLDLDDAIGTARDHFHFLGLQNLALFHCGSSRSAAGRFTSFHALVPNGHTLHQELDLKGATKIAAAQKIVGDWLLRLPKPVGILVLENTGAWRLAQICRELGLAIPSEVQLIGVGDLDECLQSEPHLTSLELPSERIGEVALETMLHHLGKEHPAPPSVIRVAGTTLIARGSTRATAVGAAKVATAIGIIQSHSTTGMSTAGMVRQLRIGHTSFYKHFRGLTGTTPAQHLRATRLKEACRMLAETSASITQIATACGFSSPEYFARFFRRETGQTPSCWRRSRERQSGPA